MSAKFAGINESTQRRISENREVRWSFLESRLRLRLIDMFMHTQATLGLSQKELAKRSGMTQPMLSRLFSGDDNYSPTLEAIIKIADALGHDIDVQLVDRQPVGHFDWSVEPAVRATAAEERVRELEDRIAELEEAARETANRAKCERCERCELRAALDEGSP